MTAIETSLKDFKEDTQNRLRDIDSKVGDMTTTNVVMKFVLGIIALLIPTFFGVWLNNYFKTRKPAAS